MESNLVCNHMSDKQNWMIKKQESDLLNISMVTDRIGLHKVLSPTMTKFEKETRHWLHVFLKKVTTEL